VWAWIAASRTQDPRRRGVFIVVFYLGVGIGLMGKGPPLFAHLAIALGAYHACTRRALPRGIVGARRRCCAGAGDRRCRGRLYVLRHVPHALELWRYESVGEFTDNPENVAAVVRVRPSLALIALPWAIILWDGDRVPVVAQGPTPAARAFVVPARWWAGTVVFFLFVQQKKDAYLLPMLPALTLMMGRV
jgi:hypothetical protein